jgi:putative glutathione S-transferase
MGPHGWQFASADEYPGAEIDPLYGSQYIKDLYLRADPEYSGRCVHVRPDCRGEVKDFARFSVPVLWDKKTETVVNNESSDIIRIFNTAFDHLLHADKAAVDLYPEEYRAEIDQINALVYETVNSALLSCFQFGIAANKVLQVECTRQARPSHRRHMRLLCMRSSGLWTSWKLC